MNRKTVKSQIRNLFSPLIVLLASCLVVRHGADGEWVKCILWGVIVLLHLIIVARNTVKPK